MAARTFYHGDLPSLRLSALCVCVGGVGIVGRVIKAIGSLWVCTCIREFPYGTELLSCSVLAECTFRDAWEMWVVTS